MARAPHVGEQPAVKLAATSSIGELTLRLEVMHRVRHHEEAVGELIDQLCRLVATVELASLHGEHNDILPEDKRGIKQGGITTWDHNGAGDDQAEGC